MRRCSCGRAGSARSPTPALIDQVRPRCPAATTRPPREPAPGPMSIRCSARVSCPRRVRRPPAYCRATERAQRLQQDAVVPRMQADGRFVQHITHALQVRAQLRRQPDALRLAAAQRRRGAVQRPDRPDRPPPGNRAGCGSSLTTSRAISRRAAIKRQPGHPGVAPAPPSWRRDRAIERPSKCTASDTGFSRWPWQAGHGVSVPSYRLVQPDLLAAVFGLEPRQLQAGAEAMRTPAVLAVVAKTCADRARGKVVPQTGRRGGGKHLPLQCRRGAPALDRGAQPSSGQAPRTTPVPMLQRRLQQFAQPASLPASRAGCPPAAR